MSNVEQTSGLSVRAAVGLGLYVGLGAVCAFGVVSLWGGVLPTAVLAVACVGAAVLGPIPAYIALVYAVCGPFVVAGRCLVVALCSLYGLGALVLTPALMGYDFSKNLGMTSKSSRCAFGALCEVSVVAGVSLGIAFFPALGVLGAVGLALSPVVLLAAVSGVISMTNSTGCQGGLTMSSLSDGVMEAPGAGLGLRALEI